MVAIKSQILTVEDFLTLPEVKPPLEFYGGRVIQKMSPRLPHSIIQLDLGSELLTYGRTTRLGRPYSELRCTFGKSSLVFDLCFFVTERLPDGTNPADRDRIKTPPDLAVEIVSPGQTIGELSRKLRSAIRRGVRLGWLIDEKKRVVHVFRPAMKSRLLKGGDFLEGEDVLPRFRLSLDQMFGWVDGRSIG